MSEEKLLTIRDVAHTLGITEKEVIDLAEQGKIPAYKIGGVYLRFKREQIDEYKKRLCAASGKQSLRKGHSLRDGLSDFFYFNDFYIAAVLIIMALIYIIYRGY